MPGISRNRLRSKYNNTLRQTETQSKLADTLIIRPTANSSSQPTTPLPRAKEIPAGEYTSTILRFDDAIVEGEIVGVDVTYAIKNKVGKVFSIRQRYYLPFSKLNTTDELLNLLSSYGLQDKSLASAAGVEERVSLSYDPDSPFGFLTNRRKLVAEADKPALSRSTRIPKIIQEEDDADDDEDAEDTEDEEDTDDEESPNSDESFFEEEDDD